MKVPESKIADGLFDFFDERNFLATFFFFSGSAVDFGLTPKFPYGELSNVFGCAAQTAARRAAPRVGKRCATKFRKSWQGSEIFFLPPLATRGQNVFRASESVAGVAARVGKNFFSKSSPKFFNEKNEPDFFLVGAPREKKKAKQRKDIPRNA